MPPAMIAAASNIASEGANVQPLRWAAFPESRFSFVFHGESLGREFDPGNPKY